MRYLLICLMAAGLGACLKAEALPQPKKSDARWNELLAEHTAGRVSRRGAIFVRFNKDVFKKEDEGRAVDGLIETVPGLEGTVTAAGPREAVLTPRGLTPGSRYLVRIKSSALKDAPKDIGDYEFVVTVLERDASLSVEPLTPDPAENGRWSLKGKIETADVEDDDKVEKTLSASVGGVSSGIAWTHDKAAKTHAFLIAGLRRQSKGRALKLTLDGAPIEARRKETREIEIPEPSRFKVAQALAVSQTEQYAAVHFTEPLDARQDLRGLIRVSSGAFTTRVEGSVLKIYPQPRVRGSLGLVIEPSVRSAKGAPLGRRYERDLPFGGEKPQVRFTGSGVILPDNETLSVPFEALNVHAVQVAAFRVYGDNVAQFLQVNALNGDQELGRVGRFLWRKTLRLRGRSTDQWRRYALDAGELLRGNRGAIIRLTLSINRGDSDYACPEAASKEEVRPEEPLKDNEDLNAVQASGWDGVEEWYEPSDARWTDRADPCKDSYYQFATGVKDSRNFLASDIGLLAKRDRSGALRVAASSLRTAQPLAGVSVTAHGFQGAALGTAKTDASGLAKLSAKGKPFFLAASLNGDRGYLKVSDGLALPVSHFDVGGERVEDGLKGFLYGERGVWRPGDEIHLTLIVEDRDGRLPKDHPAVLRLFDPRGRLAQTVVDRAPVGGFYRFTPRTAEDAPTGVWTAKARVGGAEFSKDVRVEAVMPNRLRVELDFARKSLRCGAAGQQGRLFAQWLHGAAAANLKADVSMKLSAEPTRFSRFSDHVFDDPTRQLTGGERTVFEGALDAGGRASFPLDLPVEQSAPGMLSAQFHMRVFEEGGAFSSMRQSLPLHPYPRYIGIKLPKGDQARGMLLTDTDHKVSLAGLDPDGNPVAIPRVRVTIHKIGWKWWWDKSGESLAQFASNAHADGILEENASVVDGRGSWKFKISYPEWGRYLLRACDLDGGHCAGEVFYIDWPGWAGRAKEQTGAGANMLVFDADKTEYKAGETARVRLPAAAKGRALLTVENGTRVLSSRWVALSSAPTTVPIALTRAMSPNVYVCATLIQPHRDKASDRPIRLYGVLPLSVKDAGTELAPVIQTAEEWRPESQVRLTVKEAKGRAMTYTVAVVDEGLLGLTAFSTPDPHAHFYKKEALGVTTWDLYDSVVGAYGGDLERLLALGGSEALGELREKEGSRRFPPVVRFLGPFPLKAGEVKTHELQLSAYVGAVRVMVVAGSRSAYGRADKSVPVRQPLMIQPTLPRVAGPGEELTVPVSVFAMGEQVKRAEISVSAEAPFEVSGPSRVELRFDKPGEQLAFFHMRTGNRLGAGTLRFAASSANQTARAEARLTVRAPNPPTTRQTGSWIEPGASWTARVNPHGLPGTNEVVLETSSLPPLGLERRLGDLIRYPYGCLEQTTSILFPQFFLPSLVRLTPGEKAEVEKNVRGGLERLRAFQAPNGGFFYWPGASGGNPQSFATSYVGQFLVEAERRGYAVPAEMRPQWQQYQSARAQAWNPGSGESEFEQAYRLYTLALAGKPELGAMNLLRGEPKLTGLSRWILAGAYEAAGVTEAADSLAQTADAALPAAGEPGPTFASPLRDKALLLQMLVLRKDLVRGKPLAEAVAADLSSEQWHHTQALAQSLMALARFYGEQPGRQFSYEASVGTGSVVAAASPEAVRRQPLAGFPDKGSEVTVRNTGAGRIYAALISRGVPAAGEEAPAASGLELKIDYVDAQGRAVDPTRLAQGAQVTAVATLKNLTPRRVDNIALAFLAPTGWEIHNGRWDGTGQTGLDYQDVRDDRVYSFLGLAQGASLAVPLKFTAAYGGRYFLPAATAEAMYEAALNANTGGRWVSVAGR